MTGRGAALLAGAMILASCAPARGTASVGSGPSPMPSAVAVGPAQNQVPELPDHPDAPECDREPTLIGTVRVGSTVARRSPARGATAIAAFPRINAQGAPQVFVLLDTQVGRDGETWYRALLPVRPNGTSGFIPSDAVRLSVTDYRLETDRAKLTLTLWKGCRAVRRYPIGLGTEATPTPVGSFYLISLLRPPNPNSIYGTYAYGLSAYSEAITDWEGGGIIGLHGTSDPSSIGKRKSHGCIRMRNGDIEELAEILPLGTPIDIV